MALTDMAGQCARHAGLPPLAGLRCAVDMRISSSWRLVHPRSTSPVTYNTRPSRPANLYILHSGPPPLWIQSSPKHWGRGAGCSGGGGGGTRVSSKKLPGEQGRPEEMGDGGDGGGGGGDAAMDEMREWCRAHPKIELHAHLNGSIRDSTLLGLAKDLGQKGAIVLEDVEHVITKSGRSLSECFMLFDLFHMITTDHATVTRITKEVVEDFAAENVVYLELRTTPKKNEAKGMTKRSYMKAVFDGLRAVDMVEVVSSPFIAPCNRSMEDVPMNDGCCGPERKKICVRLLLSIDRRESTAAAMETVNLALELRDSGVVGVDLSGNPNVGEWKTFLPALRHAKEKDLPITIHCGEVPNKEEINAILDFCPDRIGHACCLEDDEWRKLTSSNIPVEICLTSNVRTNLVSSIEDHHFVDLYTTKHPMIICTDDPGLFSTSLSNEYYIAASTFGLSKLDMHYLAKNAVKFVFDNEVKHMLEEIFEAAKMDLVS